MGIYTLCKAERLNSKILIGKMFEGGVSKSFSIFPIRVVYMPVEQGEASASILISVSKRRFKRAVKRNRVKRQIREAYRKNKSILLECLQEMCIRDSFKEWIDRQEIENEEENN